MNTSNIQDFPGNINLVTKKDGLNRWELAFFGRIGTFYTPYAFLKQMVIYCPIFETISSNKAV